MKPAPPVSKKVFDIDLAAPQWFCTQLFSRWSVAEDDEKDVIDEQDEEVKPRLSPAISGCGDIVIIFIMEICIKTYSGKINNFVGCLLKQKQYRYDYAG